MASRPALLSALVLAGAALAAVGYGRRPAPRPNIILVLVDTLRADALGCYGAPAATPAFDRIAAEGLRFEHAVAQAPWTTPSVVSILTSLYPHEHGQGVSVQGAPRGRVRSLPEALRAEGYRTAAFTEIPCEIIVQMPGLETCQSLPGYTPSDPRSSAARTFTAVREWLETKRQAPFFLLVHTFEVHDYFAGRSYARAGASRAVPGYQGPFLRWSIQSEAPGAVIFDSLLGASSSDMAFVRALYQAMVARVDDEVAALDRSLASLGLQDDTVLVITSDHGEGFEPARKRVHHGGRLHEDLLRIPLIIRWKGHVPPGVVRDVVESIDVVPTLLGLIDVAPDPGHRGKPLLGRKRTFLPGRVVFGPRPLSSPTAFSEESAWLVEDSGRRVRSTTRQVAMQAPPYKVIRTPAGVELYDLRHDSRETVNIAERQPDRARVLLSAADGTAGPAPVDPVRAKEALEALRSLGYIH